MKLREFVEEQERLDPEFAEARHEFQPDAALMRAMIEARQSQNLTQKELAERGGIAQTEISRIERRNPQPFDTRPSENRGGNEHVSAYLLPPPRPATGHPLRIA